MGAHATAAAASLALPRLPRAQLAAQFPQVDYSKFVVDDTDDEVMSQPLSVHLRLHLRLYLRLYLRLHLRLHHSNAGQRTA